MAEKFCVNEEDKAMVESVLGTEAVAFFISAVSNNVLSDVIVPPGDLSHQHRLSQLIEASKWNYAVHWQVAGLNSGGSVLMELTSDLGETLLYGTAKKGC